MIVGAALCGRPCAEYRSLIQHRGGHRGPPLQSSKCSFVLEPRAGEGPVAFNGDCPTPKSSAISALVRPMKKRHSTIVALRLSMSASCPVVRCACSCAQCFGVPCRQAESACPAPGHLPCSTFLGGGKDMC